ncbi:DUF222 domain-containing protein, partial [Blastococcus tunisiensis]
MGELASALDALADDDLHALVAPQLLDRTAELVRARNRIDAELSRTVRHAENVQAPEHDGQKSMASWLRGHGRLSPAAAARLVRAGRALERLPMVAAAAGAGGVSAEQVAEVARAVTPRALGLAADQGIDLAAVDAAFAQVAVVGGHQELVAV